VEITGYKDKHEYTNRNGITSIVYLMDCMDLLKQIPEKYFDLAIVDPPYRDAEDNQPTKDMRNNGTIANFGNKPTREYFDLLFNRTNNQIIWGANNFTLPNYKGFIIWKKLSISETFTMSMAELAYISEGLGTTSKVFEMIPQDKSKFHPTQKPIKLYEWLIRNYAKEGDKILDTHLGSGSSRIAADKANLPFVGCELDPYYFYASIKRFNEYSAQQTFF
jgi:site-specific DNA-methyltransferase (adenine-specific)